MLKDIQNIFIVGIKGAAMANLSRILSQMGKNVTGSDTEEEFITDKVLTESNIQITHSFEASALPQDIQLVIYSAAHGGINSAQVKEAQKRGINVKHQIEVLGEIMNDFKTSIAVCGCHGKTTTSSLMVYTMKNLGVAPSYMVGVSEFNNSYGGEYTGKDYFVIEADEYGVNPPYDKTPKLNFLNPTHAICMNIDFDHPDVYANIEETKATFLKFFEKTSKLYLCADDTNTMDVSTKLPREKYLTYGFSNEADLVIGNIQATEEHTTFDIIYKGQTSTFEISLFGEKSVSNAAGVVLALLDLGFKNADIQKAMQGFSGAKRRFEKLAYENDTYIFDDYGHHPHEIEATLNAARSRFPTRRIIVLFQPHTFSRTQNLKEDFIRALAKADQALIAPIFASARENPAEFNITSVDLGNLAKEKGSQTIQGFSSKEELLENLKGVIQKGDVIFTMGAGDVYKLQGDILEIIKNA